MSETKETEECPSEEAPSQDESFEANKSGTSETYDVKDFCPGIRIEAKDFDGKWYPAKVSDVDWTENEILVHFENWNTKFDEWIPMDSSRLRPIQKPPVLQQKEVLKFAKGEEVMAVWSANQKYPGVIQSVLPNDRYDVLFSDGFLKRLKSHKISKMQAGSAKIEGATFTDIGTKEERRERKRKINVRELFQINKRPRKKGLVHSKSQDIKTYPVSKSKNKGLVVKKPEEGKEETSTSEKIDNKVIEEKPPAPVPGTVPPTKPMIENIPATFEVKYLNGQTETWSKQLYQRSEGRTAGKLDIVILNPQGRKFRSRNEIMKYCDENGIIYSHEAFDFSAKGRPKSKSVLQTTLPLKVDPNSEDKLSFKKFNRKSQGELPVPVGVPLPPAPELLLAEPTTPKKVFIGEYEVAIENGKFICPVKVCGKHFRRENLLHMHMKHYHPEFSKYLDYTPSVTDLAYARTVGSLDGNEVSSPVSRKVVAVEKTEKSSVKPENVKKIEVVADVVKETKKAKTSESKSHNVKDSSDLSNSLPASEELVEEIPKTKFSPTSIQGGKNLNEFEPVPLENKESSLNTTIPEKSVSDSENLVTTPYMVKPSRHHRLTSRKKVARFQNSLADRIRKKRFMTQDRARSQNRLNRQQQTLQLRQQLQQPQTPQATVSSHSVVEETNSNSLNQPYTMTRYPKPHLSISNEISGKNNLLTSCKSLGPVTDKENLEKTDNEAILGVVESQNVEKIKKNALIQDRRSFLAGLIKAQNRKKKRAKKKKKTSKTESTNFENESGQPQAFEKPDDKSANNDDNLKTDEGLTHPEKIPLDQDKTRSIRLKLKRSSTDENSYNKETLDNSTTDIGFSESPSITVSSNNDENNTENNRSLPKETEAQKINETNYMKLPKSYVLLENILRNENYLKLKFEYMKENDENVEKVKGSEKKKKGKRVKKSSKDKRPKKKVRFENTVTEKGINVECESVEFKSEKKREEEKEEKMKKIGDLIEKEVKQRLEETSRDQIKINKNLKLDAADITEDSKSPLAIDNDKVEKLRRNEIINCLCGVTEEDGLMIQCDLCLCWQHGHCAGILREEDVPDKYTCAICKNPYRARSSMKYLHDQEWLKEGSLPSLSFRSKRDELINQRKTILKRSHDLSGSITLLAQVIHSLRIKVNIAEKKDHPKLWLWAKKWTEKKQSRLKEETEIKEEKPVESNFNVTSEVKTEESGTLDEKQIPKAPEPEAPIDSAECRLNLLDHLIHYQTLVDARLSCIENLVAELESMQDDAVNDETPDRYPRTKATVQMILRDLNTMKKIASI